MNLWNGTPIHDHSSGTPLAANSLEQDRRLTPRRETMGYLLDSFWLSVPAYLIFQTVVIRRSSGSSRLVAALPYLTAVMVSVFVLTGIGYAQQSSLWPLWLLVQAITLLYVVVVGFCAWPRHSSPAAR
jgi:hypothetical protein